MQHKFLKKADKLRNECLDALDIMSDLFVVSQYHSACGFVIDDMCSRWCELVWLNREWQLVEHETGNLFSVYAIPVEELCQIIDRIIDQPNYK